MKTGKENAQAELNGECHSMERLGRMEGQKWRIDAEKWFGKLAVKAALDQATEKELSILDRLQKIRVPRSRAEVVAESRADWRMRTLMKVLRREWRQALACNPTTQDHGLSPAKEDNQ